ncbi:MAG: hypothetical protein HXY52_06180 [Nitrospirae bacterium]|nr:hypothetical protein [Nitrospirota bacterium]
MRKEVVVILALTINLIFLSFLYADNNKEPLNVKYLSEDSIKKFYRETLNLREKIIEKKLELRKEFIKKNPDRDKIAMLRKEINNIRATIMKKADEAKISSKILRKTNCSKLNIKGIINIV